LIEITLRVHDDDILISGNTNDDDELFNDVNNELTMGDAGNDDMD